MLYQEIAPPSLDGAVKPSNPFGYRDSSADIAFSLARSGCDVVTPVGNPEPDVEADWTFPDSLDGMSAAVSAGAEVFWANTSLFNEHPIGELGRLNRLRVVGQPLVTVERFEDKHVCHAALSAIGIPVPRQALVSLTDRSEPTPGTVEKAVSAQGLNFPAMVKPRRGRGSAGVKLVDSVAAAAEHIESLRGPKFGSKFLIEEYLPGEEWAVTVMPPGTYETRDGVFSESDPWPLPPVLRTDHREGVMPFSGIVPVESNSAPVEDLGRLRDFKQACIEIARFLRITAPIRIDCRGDVNDSIKAIDINMKPSMTGPGRPGRERMTNLSALAAEVIGWTYVDLLAAMAANAVPIGRITEPVSSATMFLH
ncbi:hypothetical protein [Streptomyces sp. 8L]|uniref:hypothetical protein n=1 Tax=Streptomyces sp. 8L TaxID=2877242 RepID=UPI001CD3BA74|nr:hypothetical protein [Streptomyces sp. 8L]MCA1221316.1 hypothetical protein [Streptomyces sp. 8L]